MRLPLEYLFIDALTFHLLVHPRSIPVPVPLLTDIESLANFLFEFLNVLSVVDVTLKFEGASS